MRENRITDDNLQTIAAGIPGAYPDRGLPDECVEPVSRLVISAIRPNLSSALQKWRRLRRKRLIWSSQSMFRQNIIRRGSWHGRDDKS